MYSLPNYSRNKWDNTKFQYVFISAVVALDFIVLIMEYITRWNSNLLSVNSRTLVNNCDYGYIKHQNTLHLLKVETVIYWEKKKKKKLFRSKINCNTDMIFIILSYMAFQQMYKDFSLKHKLLNPSKIANTTLQTSYHAIKR